VSDSHTSPFNRLPAELDKPLDVGNGLVSASVSRRGDLLSVGTAHTSFGFVEWSAVPEFDEALRLRPDAVRRHRDAMARDSFPVVQITGPAGPGPIETTLIDGVFPRQRRSHGGWTHEIVTWARRGERAVRQRHTLRALEPAPLGLTVTCRGRIDRPPFAQITETDPLPPTGARTRVARRGCGVVFEAASLPAHAFIDVVANTPVGEWEIDDATAKLQIDWNGSEASDLVVDLVCSLSEERAATMGVSARVPEDALACERARVRASYGNRASERHDLLEVPADLAPRLDWLALRALNYVHGCSAVTVSPTEVCLVTDHRLLPLSWTRDAYYQARLLLADGSRASRALVASHLRWLWTGCERPGGRWARSHLPSGAPKDRGLQADQQLYPLLELCDYRVATGKLPELGRDARGWDELVTEAWVTLPVHDETGLLAGEENPADDLLELPYLLSSQILWWTTSVRLSELQAATGIATGIEFGSVAESVRNRVGKHFCARGPRAIQWAYATDARGATVLYNDANDLPTALAPMLGYCAPDDAVWRATMEFTFRPDNPAYCAGRWGGLGSAHTPGTWPLGDIQEWVAFSLIGERERAVRVLRRLLDATTCDGMFPEAYDPNSGRIAARPWFAWPGAVLGALYLGGTPIGRGIERDPTHGQ
jgi:hypothetical protein